jgi:4-hydroxy-3-methylbut-2-enyl diphosphate reductase
LPLFPRIVLIRFFHGDIVEETKREFNRVLKIIIAKNSGYCGGSKRGLRIALNALEEAGGRPVVTLGPLLHNPRVVEMLAARGIAMAADAGEVPSGAVVVLRAHGATFEEIDKLRERDAEIRDATCENVKKIHEKIIRAALSGLRVFLIGERGHAEVEGHLSRGGANITLISSEDDLPGARDRSVRAAVFAQTSFDSMEFDRILRLIQEKFTVVESENTVCGWMLSARESAAEVAKKVDAMIVIGGSGSANTMRLAERCAAAGVPAFRVESADEIDMEKISGAEYLGITAGASTPTELIDETVRLLKDRFGAECRDIVETA